MVATLLHPSAVPITIPSTSPMAHPVKQCSVAEKAVRLSELFQVTINILPVRVCREIQASGRGGTVALRVCDPYGGTSHRRGASPRGGRGGLGRRFLLGRHLCRRHGHVRPVGRDGCDGDAHGEGEDRGRVDAAGPEETVEARPRDGGPRPFVQRASRLAGRTWSPGRRWFLEGGGTGCQEGSGTASRRESGYLDWVVERGAILLYRRALPARGDDLFATSCPEATHPYMGSRSVAEQKVDGAGATLRRGACGHGGQGGRISGRYARDHPRAQGVRGGEQRRCLRHRMGGPDAR